MFVSWKISKRLYWKKPNVDEDVIKIWLLLFFSYVHVGSLTWLPETESIVDVISWFPWSSVKITSEAILIFKN